MEEEEVLAQIKPCECEVDGKCNFHPQCCFCEMVIRQEKEERRRNLLRELAEQKSGIKQ